ncbi:MAG TPA: aminopeptidase P family protein [Clostridiaceae bacterium]|jgi:Xaa-Pro aminopeptidase|nr:aminopeptidase P family protein [Clostridiaceae bacterium]
MSTPKAELEKRILNLYDVMKDKDYDTIIIINRINQYYFTGTMQDGVLVLRKDGTVMFFVRRSYDRAKLECPLDLVYPMKTYKDILDYLPNELGVVYMETQTVTIAIKERLQKYFKFDAVKSIDKEILVLRAVKSDYELEFIKESGRQHNYLMTSIIPSILREGMSETDFLSELYTHMLKLGYHGISRFNMFQMEMVIGQTGFGDNSTYPTNFDGPGGMKGMSPAVPIIGDRNRYLKKGDIVFVDVGYGVDGYHSDKSQVYSFKAKPDDRALEIHRACMIAQKTTADMMKEGAIPSEIYEEVMASLPDCLNENFMGMYDPVRFLGHGVGLHIDEFPIIAKGFNMPLKQNMVVSLEPKCAVKNIGTVGVEETYVIGRDGAECITGGACDIIVVD